MSRTRHHRHYRKHCVDHDDWCIGNLLHANDVRRADADDAIRQVLRDIDEAIVRRHPDGTLPDFPGDGPDEIRTICSAPACFCCGAWHRWNVTFEEAREALLATRKRSLQVRG